VNLFLRADEALVRHVFQPIVDVSQKRPLWWFRKLLGVVCLSAMFDVALRGLDSLLTPAGVINLVACTVSVAGLSLIATSDLFVAIVGEMVSLRLSLTGFLVVPLAANILLGLPTSAAQAAGYTQSAAIIAMLYFAACRPPKPPLRKSSTKLVLT
jgi:hypothetical protein